MLTEAFGECTGEQVEGWVRGGEEEFTYLPIMPMHAIEGVVIVGGSWWLRYRWLFEKSIHGLSY